LSCSKRILVAPLNWGLGHAARCIPIIEELLKRNAEVIIASDGRALELLKKEFPNLKQHALPPYEMRYWSSNMLFNIGAQLPKILLAVYKEHQRTNQLVDELNIDAILSDNRYGCRSKKVQSVLMTHQLNIKIPFSPLEKIVGWVNHRRIKKFDECWVPDVEGADNLSGTLSQSSRLKKVKFIGILSRMKPGILPQKYDCIALLSGPEPQRTYLERKIIGQAKKLPFQFLIVQGKTERKEHFFIEKNIEVYSFLTSKELNDALLASEIVISRSGYSSLMDLAVLKKKAILIPTPGQTEQAYLAKRFSEQGAFLVQSQENLNLKEALEKVRQFKGLEGSFFKKNRLGKVIQQFLEIL
jgi:UDP:flavonoid glycosyltransferase YjiC (YdhE family)